MAMPRRRPLGWVLWPAFGAPVPVSSLRCFTCDNVESNWDCMGSKECDKTEEYCMTKYFGGGVGENYKKSISKGCASVCPQGGVDIGIMALSMKCCKSSLCNISGAISVKSSSLMLTAGILASLFHIFQTKL